MIILEECEVAVWKEREMAWIAQYKDDNVLLCNHTEGGDGSNPNAAAREKMRLAKLGKPPHNKGKKASDEVRARMSEAAKNRVVRDPEALRQRMLKLAAVSADKSRGMVGRKKTAQEIEKIRIGMKGKQNTKGLKQSAEVVARRAERLKGHAVSEETRRKIGAANSKLSESQMAELDSMLKRGVARDEIMLHFGISQNLYYVAKRRISK